MKFPRLLFAWLVAAACAAILGSIIQTQFTLGALAALGAPVGIAARLQTTLQDLAGFAPVFGLVAAAGFIPAFLVAALLARWWPRQRTLLFALAGAAAVGVAILVMNAALPITPIGATRSAWGLAALTAAGLPGGLLFAALAPGRRPATGV